MNILLLSATAHEIAPLMPQRASFPGKHLDILVSGIGNVATAYHLTRQLHLQHYDVVLHAGIAGSFSDAFPPGSVVQITEDVFAALGVEDLNTFKTAHSLGFNTAGSGEFPYTQGFLVNPAPPLPVWSTVRGVTADTVSGSESTIGRMNQLFQPQVETMESAACFYVCLSQQQCFHSVRSISNVVAPRSQHEWETGQAIASLHTALCSIISGL